MKANKITAIILSAVILVVMTGCSDMNEEDIVTESGKFNSTEEAVFETTYNKKIETIDETSFKIAEGSVYEVIHAKIMDEDELINDDLRNEQFFYDEYKYHIEIEYYRLDEAVVNVPIEIDGKPVTTIKDAAFLDKSLTKVTLPETITNIHDFAFSGCLNLTDINIPNDISRIDNSTFAGCTSLTDIIIPNSVTSIGIAAFAGCSSLKSIIIPENVTSIEGRAFEDCSNLNRIIIQNSVVEIGGDVFDNTPWLEAQKQPVIINGNLVDYSSASGDVVIPDSVTSICGCAFKNSNITGVVIPNSVTKIGGQAFKNCENLTKITIPNSVEEINDYVFDNTPWLEMQKQPVIINGNLINYSSADGDVILSDDVRNICSGAFCDSNLKSIVIPDSVTIIRSHTFCNCSKLARIDIPKSVTNIEESAFANCSDLENVNIPNSMTKISYYTFYGCSSLKKILIPNSVTDIGVNAFEGCTSLTSVTIPDSVTYIGLNAFKGCTSLTSITIPDSVTHIGTGAFEGCTSLTGVTIPDSVTLIGFDAFNNCPNLTNITIPDKFNDRYNDIFS